MKMNDMECQAAALELFALRVDQETKALFEDAKKRLGTKRVTKFFRDLIKQTLKEAEKKSA
jgi:hypothetical protein